MEDEEIDMEDEEIDMEDEDSPHALPESVPGPIREMSRGKLAIEF